MTTSSRIRLPLFIGAAVSAAALTLSACVPPPSSQVVPPTTAPPTTAPPTTAPPTTAPPTTAPPTTAPPTTEPPAEFSHYAAVDYGTGRMLDLYVPEGEGPFPVMVWVHGGFWTAGSRNDLPVGFRDHMLDSGYAVATVDYRLVGAVPAFEPAAAPHPAQVIDIKKAIKYLADNATTYDLDATRVVLSGHSAGGHLAMMVAASEGTTAPLDLTIPGEVPVLGAIGYGAPTDAWLVSQTVAVASLRGFVGCSLFGDCWNFSRADVWRLLDADDPAIDLVVSTGDILVGTAHINRMETAAATAGYTGFTSSTVTGISHDNVNTQFDPVHLDAWLATLTS